MKAPYDDFQKPVAVDVCISVTMHKNARVILSHYDEEIIDDEDGDTQVKNRFSKESLVEAVESQIDLPQERVDGWTVDEMEVIEE